MYLLPELPIALEVMIVHHVLRLFLIERRREKTETEKLVVDTAALWPFSLTGCAG